MHMDYNKSALSPGNDGQLVMLLLLVVGGGGYV
jgi:hypothetical protein